MYCTVLCCVRGCSVRFRASASKDSGPLPACRTRHAAPCSMRARCKSTPFRAVLNAAARTRVEGLGALAGSLQNE